LRAAAVVASRRAYPLVLRAHIAHKAYQRKGAAVVKRPGIFGILRVYNSPLPAPTTFVFMATTINANMPQAREQFKQILSDYERRLRGTIASAGLLSPQDRTFLTTLYKGVNMTPDVNNRASNEDLARIYRFFWKRLRGLYIPGFVLSTDPSDPYTPRDAYIPPWLIVQRNRTGVSDHEESQAIVDAAFEPGTYSYHQAHDFADQAARGLERTLTRVRDNTLWKVAPTATLAGPLARGWVIERGLCQQASQPLFILLGRLTPIDGGQNGGSFSMLWYGNGPLVIIRSDDQGNWFPLVNQLPTFLGPYTDAVYGLLMDAASEAWATAYGLVPLDIDTMAPSVQDFVSATQEHTYDDHPARDLIAQYRLEAPFYGAYVEQCDLLGALAQRSEAAGPSAISLQAPAALGPLAALAARSYGGAGRVPLSQVPAPQEVRHLIAAQRWQGSCRADVVAQTPWETLIDTALAVGIDPGEIVRDPMTGAYIGTHSYYSKDALCRDIGMALSGEPVVSRNM